MKGIIVKMQAYSHNKGIIESFAIVIDRAQKSYHYITDRVNRVECYLKMFNGKPADHQCRRAHVAHSIELRGPKDDCAPAPAELLHSNRTNHISLLQNCSNF